MPSSRAITTARRETRKNLITKRTKSIGDIALRIGTPFSTCPGQKCFAICGHIFSQELTGTIIETNNANKYDASSAIANKLPQIVMCANSSCKRMDFSGLSRDCSVTITGHNTNAQKRSCHLGGDSVVHRAMCLRNDYAESDEPMTQSLKPFSTKSTQSPSFLSVRDEFVASCESQMQLRISQPPARIRDGLWILPP